LTINCNRATEKSAHSERSMKGTPKEGKLLINVDASFKLESVGIGVVILDSNGSLTMWFGVLTPVMAVRSRWIPVTQHIGCNRFRIHLDGVRF
jgi:hypothetical protein